MTTSTAIPARLLQALKAINASAPRLISSPTFSPGQAHHGASRRASVAIIIRIRPTEPVPPSPGPEEAAPATPAAAAPSAEGDSAQENVPSALESFFAQRWVQTGVPELLFIKRASRTSDRWSSHIAFPGGRSEPDDEDSKYTAMRETWEEVGLDLAERDWLSVGQLDDREITSSLGKRLLMILSPYVFLHRSPHAPVPELQESEVASAHFIPIELLHPPQARWGSVSIDIPSRIAPRSRFARVALRLLIGDMHFKCLLLPNNPIATGLESPEEAASRAELRLWGLTLGMTLDLLSGMSVAEQAHEASKADATPKPYSPAHLATYPHAVSGLDLPSPAVLAGTMAPFAPSMTSIFPRFTYPDINFLIYLFGRRYRRLLGDRAAAIARERSQGTPDARVNWAGAALGSYYASVRKALVVAIVARAVAALAGLGLLGWWARVRWALYKARH